MIKSVADWAATIAVYVLLFNMARVLGHMESVVKALRTIPRLHEDVARLLIAHNHHVEGMDRRLETVESAAAEAAQEARIVSHQLGEIAEVLDARTAIRRRIRAAINEDDPASG